MDPMYAGAHGYAYMAQPIGHSHAHAHPHAHAHAHMSAQIGAQMAAQGYTMPPMSAGMPASLVQPSLYRGGPVMPYPVPAAMAGPMPTHAHPHAHAHAHTQQYSSAGAHPAHAVAPALPSAPRVHVSAPAAAPRGVVPRGLPQMHAHGQMPMAATGRPVAPAHDPRMEVSWRTVEEVLRRNASMITEWHALVQSAGSSRSQDAGTSDRVLALHAALSANIKMLAAMADAGGAVVAYDKSELLRVVGQDALPDHVLAHAAPKEYLRRKNAAAAAPSHAAPAVPSLDAR